MRLIKYTKLSFLIVLILMNVSCDQITKNEVRENIQLNEIIKVIDSNVVLTKVENTGAALSLGSELPPVFKLMILKIVPLLLLVGLFGFLIVNLELRKIHQIGLAFIIGGGIGNLIDRIKFDSVTDFMLLELGPLKTGVFNMADVSIFLGVVVILATSFSDKKTNNIAAKLS